MNRGDQNRELSGFMSNLDINLRNKLSVLLPALDLLEKRISAGGEPDDAVLRYLGEARRSAFSILRMASNMRDYALYINDYGETDPATTDLAELFHSVVSETEKMAAYKPAVISLTCSEKPFYAYVDSVKIERLLYNLLSNAVLHGEGDVSVSLERSGGSILISVRNGGAPISEAALSRLYEGYREFTAPEGAEKNLGLGLPVALAIVCQSGGTLMVTSDEQSGTVVTASLPDLPHEDTGVLDTYRPVGGFPKHLIELADFPAYNRQYNVRKSSAPPRGEKDAQV